VPSHHSRIRGSASARDPCHVSQPRPTWEVALKSQQIVSKVHRKYNCVCNKSTGIEYAKTPNTVGLQIMWKLQG